MLKVHRSIPRRAPARPAGRRRRRPVWPRVATGPTALRRAAVALVGRRRRRRRRRRLRPDAGGRGTPASPRHPPRQWRTRRRSTRRSPTRSGRRRGPMGPGTGGSSTPPSPGDAVRASAPGTVVFAGPVAGSLHVTIRHADGVRTSYSFLAGRGHDGGGHGGRRRPDRHRGRAAALRRPGGRCLLRPGRPVHGRGRGRAPAVRGAARRRPPTPRPGRCSAGPPRAGGVACRSATSGRRGGGCGPRRRRAPRLSRVVRARRRRRPRPRAVRASDLVDRLLFPGPCSPGPAAVPARGRRAAGGDHRGGPRVDQRARRHRRPAHVRPRLRRRAGGPVQLRRRPHAGLRPGPRRPRRPRLLARATPRGTSRCRRRRLADLVEQVAAADPEAQVDVYAHSLGGLVMPARAGRARARVAFDLGRLGLVATFGSPHRGADLATAVAAAADARGRAPPSTPRPASSASASTPTLPVVASSPSGRRSSRAGEAGRARGRPPRVDRGPGRPGGGRAAHRVDGAAEVTVPVAGLGGPQRPGGLGRGDGRAGPGAGRSATGLRGVARRRGGRHRPAMPSRRRGPQSASFCRRRGDGLRAPRSNVRRPGRPDRLSRRSGIP